MIFLIINSPAFNDQCILRTFRFDIIFGLFQKLGSKNILIWDDSCFFCNQYYLSCSNKKMEYLFCYFWLNLLTNKNFSFIYPRNSLAFNAIWSASLIISSKTCRSICKIFSWHNWFHNIVNNLKYYNCIIISNVA